MVAEEQALPPLHRAPQPQPQFSPSPTPPPVSPGCGGGDVYLSEERLERPLSSSRFVRETLRALTKDGERARSPTLRGPGSRCPSRVGRPSGSPEPSPSAPTTAAGSPVPFAASSESARVASFLENWGKQLLDWRRLNEASVKDMQDHVETLMASQDQLQHFLQQYVTSQEFASFRNALADHSRLVDELACAECDKPSALLKALEAAVEQSVSNGFKAVQKDTLAEEERWARIAEEQHSRWSAELGQRFDLLEMRMRRLVEEMQCLDANSKENVDKILSQVSHKLEAVLASAAESIGNANTQASLTVSEKFMNKGKQSVRDLEVHMQRLLLGPDRVLGEEDRGVLSYMNSFDKKLTEGVTSHEQAMRWLEELDAEREKMEEEEEKLKACHANEKSLHKSMQDLEKQLQEREQKLDEAQAALDAPVGWQTIMDQIQSAQSQGYVTFDLLDGNLEVVQGLDFVPRAPTEAPEAAFTDENAVTSALEDAAMVIRTFAGVQAVVESHLKQAKGAAPFWERLAVSRAELVRNKLEELGVTPGQLAVAGFVGKKGLDRPCIRVRLAIFPRREDALQKGKR